VRVDRLRRQAAKVPEHRGVRARERRNPAGRGGLGWCQPSGLLGELLEPTNGRGVIQAASPKLSPAPLQIGTGDIGPLSTSAAPERTVDAPKRLEVSPARVSAKATREEPHVELVGQRTEQWQGLVAAVSSRKMIAEHRTLPDT
jgi:hypothetical protein